MKAIKKNSSGLTLMELIIVVGVLGILIAVASPVISQFSSGYKLRGAAREMATDLQFARLLAVKENKDLQVLVSSSSYQVVRSDGSVVKTRDFAADYPEITLAVTAVSYPLAFNSRGNCKDSNSATISVSHPLAGTKNITVATTGRVKLG